MANFDENIIQAVWEKATIDPNNDPKVFRKDYAGAWIRRNDYGNRKAKYGWEIDHLKPIKMGGTDDLCNLLPLHWQNNQKKGDDFPKWKTEIASESTQNIEKIQSWYVDQ